MQAMLIEDDPAARAVSAAALSRAGFEVTVAGSVDAAKAAVRRGIVDVLVMAERVGGRLAHDVALLAELRNPGLGTILLSDRGADEVDEIFALLPSLHAVLGRDTPPRMLTDLALAAARWQGHAPPAPAPRSDATPGAPEAAASAASVEVPEHPRSVASPVDVAPPPLHPGPAQAEPGPAWASEPTPAVPDRTMPPPLPAPARVPSFLRVGGLSPAPDVEVAPAPRPALQPRPPARRLHLA